MAWCPRDHQFVPQTTCLGLFFQREMHQETYHCEIFTGTTYLGASGGLREIPQKTKCMSVIVK